ncbi:MAG: hypothetical protein DHS20C17_25750 [Cyclobacteriaceae bacterium]|nr:MAG: hypothetical protein DHS20C17_25750 [Cyclobacteriaceae bacterium]
MKPVYLFLSIVGFILPNIWVAKVTIETGNVLFWWDIPTTFSQMFANDIATAFGVDLLFVVVVFFVWSYNEARKYQIKRLGLVWLLTLVLGLAGAFPLFLYLREKNA